MLYYQLTLAHINIMSHYSNTLFTSYYESHINDNIYEIEGDQGKVLASIPTNNQDRLINL